MFGSYFGEQSKVSSARSGEQQEIQIKRDLDTKRRGLFIGGVFRVRINYIFQFIKTSRSRLRQEQTMQYSLYYALFWSPTGSRRDRLFAGRIINFSAEADARRCIIGNLSSRSFFSSMLKNYRKNTNREHYSDIYIAFAGFISSTFSIYFWIFQLSNNLVQHLQYDFWTLAINVISIANEPALVAK